MKTILINHPGDGDWVMGRNGGVFCDKRDNVIALHRDGKIAGGVAYTGFTGGAVFMHMAGSEDNWATPDFLWMVYDYAFNQLGLPMVLGPVAASNKRALAIDKRMGFKFFAILPGVLWGREDLVILKMDREDYRGSKFLQRLKPRHYRRVEELASHGGR